MWVNHTYILSDRKMLQSVRVQPSWINQTILNASNILNIVWDSMLMVFEQCKTKSTYQHNCHIHSGRFYDLPLPKEWCAWGWKQWNWYWHESASKEQGKRTCPFWLHITDVQSQELCRSSGSGWMKEQLWQFCTYWHPLQKTSSVTELFAPLRSVLRHQLKSSVTKSGFLLSSELFPAISIRQEQWSTWSVRLGGIGLE